MAKWYSFKLRQILVILIILNRTISAYAQAPKISYPSPQVYTEYKTITPLTPTNAGGVVPPTVYGQVSVFAGSGAVGAVNNAGKAASFGYPSGIALSPSGDFFVSEALNNTIRKITAQAQVSTFAGTAPKSGYVEGKGTTARFSDPTGLAIDVSGNIYVTDAANNVIRKITPDGTVSTYAGSGKAGNNNGTALKASFNHPTGVALDSYGNLYVVDQNNNLARKIATDGTVSTYAGNGPISFNLPYGIAIDAANNVYVSDQNSIRKISIDGTVTTFAGGALPGTADGIGTAAGFNRPEGLAFDGAGNLYVADTGNDLIRRITPQQKVTTVGRDPAGATANEKNFNQPTGLVIDASGNAYITEFWGGIGPSGTGGNVISQLILTGYTIDKLLPAGLLFNPQTGTISGTPVVQSPPTDYTITAYNSDGISSFVVNISVTGNNASTQTITFNPIPDKTYGDVDFDPGAASTNNTIPITYASSNMGVATVVNGLIHITGAGTSQITASQAGNESFIPANPVTQMLTVAQAPLLIMADNKSKYSGQPNPPLTFTATGFVYNENPSVLTTQPVLSTSVTTNSLPGSYPIEIAGATATNYMITMLPGTFTIEAAETSLVIPNVFTPNGDGINDVWNIKAIEAFPQCVVSVFERNGSLVFQSKGYGQPWDGTYKGSPIPPGTYFYVITPANGLRPLSGSVTILR